MIIFGNGTASEGVLVPITDKNQIATILTAVLTIRSFIIRENVTGSLNLRSGLESSVFSLEGVARTLHNYGFSVDLDLMKDVV